MNVLFICHRVPFPPKRGGKIRPFNIIRHLTSQGHRVTVASMARTPQELEESKGLSAYCNNQIVEVIRDWPARRRMLFNVPTATPSSFGYFWSPALLRRIKIEVARQQPDLVFVHCSSVAPFAKDLLGVRKILDYGDVDSQKWREYAACRCFPLSAVFWLEALKLERTERLLSLDADLCTCTTRAELESLQALGVNAAADWFPNGVDTDFFTPPGTQYDRRQIVFVGRMDYYPNQQAVKWFCAEVWPEMRRRFTDLHFLIVGADPPPSIEALAEMAGVTVTGSVPDVRPFLGGAALSVAPLFIARGTQNKILESLSIGTPVICSRQASGGVDVLDGEHLVVADTATDWIARIEEILRSPARRDELSRAGRARVLSHHTWPASMRRLDGMITNVMRMKQSQ